MDKVLSVQHLSVLDLLDPAEVNKRASILPPSDDEFENVLLTDPSTAATQPLITSMHVQEILKFKKNFLREGSKPEVEGDRSSWQRLVLIKLDAREAITMYPRLLPGSTLLIDRHYNSLKAYRKGEFNMYAVLKNDTCAVRYVEMAGNHLICAPQSILSHRSRHHRRPQDRRRLPCRPHLPRSPGSVRKDWYSLGPVMLSEAKDLCNSACAIVCAGKHSPSARKVAG